MEDGVRGHLMPSESSGGHFPSALWLLKYSRKFLATASIRHLPSHTVHLYNAGQVDGVGLHDLWLSLRPCESGKGMVD